MTELIIKFVNFIYEHLILKVFAPLNNIIPENIFTSMTQTVVFVVDLFQKINFIIPVNDIFVCLSIIILIRIAMFSMFGLNWVIRRIFDVIP